MSDESVLSEEHCKLPSVFEDTEEKRYTRSAREEWRAAKITEGEKRRVHLFWCAQYAQAVNDMRFKRATRL